MALKKKDFRPMFRHKMSYNSGQELYINKSLRTNLHIVMNTSVQFGVCRSDRVGEWEKTHFGENGL